MKLLGRPDNNHKAWLLAASLFTASLLVCTSPVYADEGWKDNSIASQNDAAQSTGNDTKDVLWDDDTNLVTTPPEEEESSIVSTTKNAEEASDQEKSNKTKENETSENKDEASLPLEVVKQGKNLVLRDTNTGEIRKDNAFVALRGKYYFPNAQGKLYRNRFITFGPKVAYYMGDDGSVMHGLVKVGDKLYLLDSETGILHKENRWVKQEGKYYFPNAQGKLYRNRFITFGPKVTYYMGDDGSVMHGLVKVGDKLYLLDSQTGILHKENRWVKQEGKYYFPNAQGEVYHNRFITFGPKVAYYMGSEGTRMYGVQQVGDALYLLDEKTGLLRKDNRWVSNGGKEYFPNAQGQLYRNRFIHFGPKYSYFMGSDGSKQVGRLKLKDAFYILHPVTGQVQFRNAPGYRTVDGQRFYVDATGAFRLVGQWVTKNGKSYYPKGDGTYYHNEEITVAQKKYYIGADGATIPGVHRVGQNLYYYDPALNNERRQRSGVVQWRGQQYYVGSKGNILTNQIVQVGDTVKQADANGILRTTTRRLVIDLSYHQRPDDFNFDAFTNGVSGVILRAGYTGHGTGNSYYRDTAFERFYREFNARGIPIGAYWYACANTVEEGIAEAKEFKKALAGKKFALPVYWDTEDQYHQRNTDKKTLTDTALAFLKEMEKSGYYTGIYASASWFYEKLQMERLKDYDVWVAHYGVASPAYHGDYNLWQFTSRYKKDGFPRQLDANWMLVDYPAIIKKARRNGF